MILKNKSLPGELAASYALSHQPEQAILYIQQAIQRDLKATNHSLFDDPDFEPLRNLKRVPGYSRSVFTGLEK